MCVFPNNGTRLRDTVTMFDDTGNDEMNEKRKPRCSARGEVTIINGKRIIVSLLLL